MGKRPAPSKTTRGLPKKKIHASSSNPKTTKFRSQINSLSVIAKGGPTKKRHNKQALKQGARDARDRQKLLNGLEKINMIGHDGDVEFDVDPDTKTSSKRAKNRSKQSDGNSDVSQGTRHTTASFASVWSNCTNDSLNEFFQVWNPNLETHKDALAVIAGLSQTMSKDGTEQTDIEFSKILFKIISSPDTPVQVLTGALLALTFVMRKLPKDYIVDNFDHYYLTLKSLIEKHETTKKKTLLKCLLRCFSCLSRAHPLGKEAIDSSTRKKINIAIRRCRVQDKIRL